MIHGLYYYFCDVMDLFSCFLGRFSGCKQEDIN